MLEDQPLVRTGVELRPEGQGSATDEGVLNRIASEFCRFTDSAAALKCIQEKTPDLVLIAPSAATHVALAFLKQLRRHTATVPVVVLASQATADEAVQFMRAGASDYFQGPLAPQSFARLAELVLLRPAPDSKEMDRFFSPDCPPGVPIVGRSKGLRSVLSTVQAISATLLGPVLIEGETGTGKELIAQAVHVLRCGDRGDFIPVNCATLTSQLLESELFGHVKGAFTGADREKEGLFELAGGGTIFLDEISEMPSNLQAKLLRVLQERKFRKVGGAKEIPYHATIVASSNRNLAEETRRGNFRPDLYYRLATFPIVLPPLRHETRREDIPLLAEYFVETVGGAVPGPRRRLSAEATEALLRYHWPGNVRELRNAIERALVLEKGPEITPRNLVFGPVAMPEEAGQPVAPSPSDLSLETAERIFITRALQEAGGQRTRAAALLGITRATLHAKLKRYKIAIPEPQNTSDPTRLPTSGSRRFQAVNAG